MSKNMNQTGRKSLLRRMISSWLIICMLVSVFSVNVSAVSAPGLDDPITEENVLRLLKAYDKDGYFLVNYGHKKQTPFMNYYNNSYGQNRLISNLDTVVHEEFHDYSIVEGQKQRIYIGNHRSIIVDFTKIFYSKQMVKSVPKRCRTTRFPTYVSKPIDRMASNVQGIYGLLNEFSAYGWGMHNDNEMYDYYNKVAPDMSTWNGYVSDGASNRLAYAEFKYYILHYLYYAKNHYPLVYKQIMANKNFRRAYKLNEKQFWKMIKTYENNLNRLEQKLETMDYVVEYTDEMFVASYQGGRSSGMSLLNDEYSVLMKELKKSRYVNLQKALTR